MGCIGGVISMEKNKSMLSTFSNAYHGIIKSLKAERNMKIHISMVGMVSLCGWLLHISKYEWMVCILLFAGVISHELINTAIEYIVDVMLPYPDEKAKIIKDIAAGAVLIWAIASVIIGGIIFAPKVVTILVSYK